MNDEKESKRDKTPLDTGGLPNRKTLIVMLGMRRLNQIKETRKSFAETGRTVQNKREYLPKPLRFLSFIGGLFLTAGCLGAIVYFVSFLFGGCGVGAPIAGIGLGIGIPVYASMRGLDAYLERQDWIKRTVEKDKIIKQSTSDSKQE
jgi:hypothetical protein